MACQYCGWELPPSFVATPQLTHHGKLVCSRCGKFQKWVAKEKDDITGKVTSRKRNKNLLSTLLETRESCCELCRRPAGHLPPRVVLEVHHVVEVQDGGTDDESNLWILCSDCHKDVHHRRRQFRPYWDARFLPVEAVSQPRRGQVSLDPF